MTRFCFSLLLLSTFLQLLHACSEVRTTSRTQLMLVSDTDLQELDEVVFEVTSPSGDTKSASGPILTGSPAFLAMAHESDSALGPYQVEARGMSAGQLVISRTAQVSFVAGRSLTVLLHLVRACLDAVCAEGQTCGVEGCRATTLAQAELLPWSGLPPKLEAESTSDAGGDEDAGVGEDGGNDASEGCLPSCEGTSERVCVQGVLSEPRACTSTKACLVAACEPGVGCVQQPAKDGLSCGVGLVCNAGVCGPGQACGATKCDPMCRGGVQGCLLDCGSSGGGCKAGCAPGSSCNVQCADSSSCEVTCESGAVCDIECAGDSDCTRTKCRTGAVCTLHCGANSRCLFNQCEGGQPLSCPNGLIVCHGACP